MKRLLSLMIVLLVFGAETITALASAGLTRIDSSTFARDYTISSIHIGSDVDEITSTALRNLIYLNDITVSENNPYFASYSGCLYDKAMTELLRYPPALKGAYIPSTVVSIGDNALYGVPRQLKDQIISVVEVQASGNLKESEVPGAHFVHTENGVKWKQEDGTVISPTSNLMNLAAEVVNLSSTADMTQPQQLEAAFNYVAGTITYVRSMEVPTGDWTGEYASKTLGSKTGNCYGYAAAFAYIARGLGYDARVCVGTVTSALGGRTAHSWTEVKMGDDWYIFDAEMQAAKSGGYYKQTYSSYPAGPVEKTSSWTVNY